MTVICDNLLKMMLILKKIRRYYKTHANCYLTTYRVYFNQYIIIGSLIILNANLVSYIFWYCHFPPSNTSWSVSVFVMVIWWVLKQTYIFPITECWLFIFLQLKIQVNDWFSYMGYTTELWSYKVNFFHFLRIASYFL